MSETIKLSEYSFRKKIPAAQYKNIFCFCFVVKIKKIDIYKGICNMHAVIQYRSYVCVDSDLHSIKYWISAQKIKYHW